MNPYREQGRTTREDLVPDYSFQAGLETAIGSVAWKLGAISIALGLALTAISTACSPTAAQVSAENAAAVSRYVTEMEACEHAFPPDDCTGYLACRHKVQIAHKQAPTLECADVDGGAP